MLINKSLNKDQIYKKVKEHNIYLAYLRGILSLLYWDDRVTMPKLANEYRGKQIAILTEYIHKLKTSKKYSKLINMLDENDYEKYSEQWVNIKWWKYLHNRDSKIPPKLISKLSNLIPISINRWEKAKENKPKSLKDNNLKEYLNYLEKIIEINKEFINLWGSETEPYEALLKEYEPSFLPSEIQNTFDDLLTKTKELINKYYNRSQKVTDILKGEFDIKKQEEFCKFLIKKIGFSEDFSRLDPTSHPFASSISPKDIRITTKYIKEDIGNSIFGTLHELGHAIYDYNLPEEYFGQPKGSAVSLSVHESQSRFWENIIGRSIDFWNYFYPYLKNYFEVFNKYSVMDFVKAANKIDLQPIRIEADELTYNLHIILRFNIERKIFNENLKVKEIPELWNELFYNYFGYKLDNYSQGFLQDIHWAESLFGYFPTYTLGNIISAQIYYNIKSKLNLNELLLKGEFNPIIEYLKENIYKHGMTYTTKELINKITSKNIDANYLYNYFDKKYSLLYG
ncbi:MAG: carboxypeptidase M32 [bacterium]